MKSHALLLGLILSLQFTACASDPYPISPRDRQSHAVTVDAFNQLRKEFDTLQLAGLGSSVDGKIKSLSVSLTFHGVRTKHQIRHILLRVIDVYLQTINSSEEIQPYLYTTPFTEANLEVALVIRSSEGIRLEHPHVSIAYLSDETITFLTTENDGMDIKTREKESLELARRIAAEKNH